MAQKQLKNLKPSIRKCLTTRFEPATMKTGCTNLVWGFAAHCRDDHQGGDTDSEFGTISSEESHLRLCSYPKIHDFDGYGIKKTNIAIMQLIHTGSIMKLSQLTKKKKITTQGQQ